MYVELCNISINDDIIVDNHVHVTCSPMEQIKMYNYKTQCNIVQSLRMRDELFSNACVYCELYTNSAVMTCMMSRAGVTL